MDISSFDQWIDTLGKALENAKKMGVSKQVLEKGATHLGNYLESNVNPDVPENQFLKELWSISDDQEKQALAGMMVKYVEHHNSKH